MSESTPVREHRFVRARLLGSFWQRMPRWARERAIWSWADKFLVSVNGVCLSPRGEVLLLEQRFARTEHDRWNMPGGFVRHGEHPEEALAREIREETGLEATIVLPLYVFRAQRQIHLSYLCFVPDRQPVLDTIEIAGYEWIGLESPDPRRRLERERAAKLLPVVWPGATRQ